MNRLVDPQLIDHSVTARPGGLRGLILRVQVSPVGYRLMTIHDTLLQKVGALGYSFLICVVAPTLVGFLYLTLWATHEYESETRFTVRAATEAPSALADALSVFSSFGYSKTSAQDGFVIADYIRSRAIIEDLGGAPLIHELYSKRSIDWFSRLASDATKEDIWKFWNRKVAAILSTQSNILTIRVRANSPEGAHRLADMILKRSEALVNEISERSRSDALNRADIEVQSAIKRLGLARQNMLEFRNKSSVINPVSSASSIGTTLNLLTRDKLALENTRSTLSGVIDENSPTRRILQTQIESLDKQIRQLQERLTSQQNSNVISGQISSFEELQLETQFAERMLTISQSAYERARMDQDKQQLYLVPIVRPTLPEEAKYPRVLMAVSMLFVTCVVIWSMLALIIAAIKDHLG
jgi:capsular polysaccharide transport system permease protein